MAPWTCLQASRCSPSAPPRRKRGSPNPTRWRRSDGSMPLLAVETSCDETSVAVVHEGRVLSNVVSSQTKLHEEYGGVVPELAAPEHLRNLLPAARMAFQE